MRERLLVTSGQCKLQGRVTALWGSLTGGMRRVSWIFVALADEGQSQEVFVSDSKQKGKKELKNLECSINFDTRGVGSSRVKGKRVVAVVM